MRFPPLGKTLADLANSYPYKVDGHSMSPGLEHGQLVLARAVTSGSPALARGRIVVLRHPTRPKTAYIKRIVGLPGESIVLKKGVTYIDGAVLPEVYLTRSGPHSSINPGEWQTGDQEYFVLGDNRSSSQDSRTFGPIDRKLVLGVVWLRYWPPHSWSRID